MAKWTDYTTDTNPTDTDEVMTLDTDKTPKANKRVTLSTLADYFLDKLASKVFAKLETQNQTVIGALNELNSKSFPVIKVSSSEAVSLLDDIKSNCIFSNNNNEKSFIVISLFNSWYGYQIMFYGNPGNIQFRTFWGSNGFSDWNTLPI